MGGLNFSFCASKVITEPYDKFSALTFLRESGLLQSVQI